MRLQFPILTRNGATFSLSLFGLFAAFVLSTPAFARPHHHSHSHHKAVHRSTDPLLLARRSLAGCQPLITAAGGEIRAIERRMEMVESLRGPAHMDQDENREQETTWHPLGARDFNQALATNHHSSQTGLGAHPSDSSLFSGSGGCVLQPEVTVGPYWVKGELIRSDISENQAGVPLYLEYQIVDYRTCKPVQNMYVDIWHANATGVYSGVVAHNNGNNQDQANLKRTHNRGIQKTDASGVVTFKTIFPGHYTGRAQHIHLITTVAPSTLSNQTLTGGHVTHVGQVFFDAALIAAVEATAPYSSNSQPATQNKNDDIMAQESDGAGVDPVMQYVWLGSTPAQGVLAWIMVGVDAQAQYSPRPAEVLGEQDGAPDNENGGAEESGGGSGSGHASGGLGTLLSALGG